MDLTCWMEPRNEFKPRAIEWLDICSDSGLVEKLRERIEQPFEKVLRIEQLGGPDSARHALSDGNVLGVYCLSTAGPQKINGLEVFDPEHSIADTSDSLIVAVRLVEPDSGVSAGLDLLREDVATCLLEALEQEISGRLNEKEDGAYFGLHFSRKNSCQEGDQLWCEDLPRLYREKYDEDMLDRLPLLWFNGPDCELYRWRIRQLLAEIFDARFLSGLREYAEKCPATIVGRFDPDASIIGQIQSGWGPVMRLMQAFPVQGVMGSDDSAYSILAFKQAASVSAQVHAVANRSVRKAARPVEVQNELFRRSGGMSSLADFWADAENTIAMGAGVLSTPEHHRSLRGDGKRQSGPAFFHEAQPWWPEMEYLTDCIGRINEMMSQGEQVVRVLVLNPADSLMALTDQTLPASMSDFLGKPSEINAAARDCESTFVQLLEYLDLFQISFEIADEEMIEKDGHVVTNSLQIGQREYTTIVMPPALSWRYQTMKLIRRFVRKGGNLVLPRPVVEMMDFEKSEAITEMVDAYANAFEVERPGREVCWQVNRLDPPPYQFKALGDSKTDSLVVQHRRTETHDLFYIVNKSRDKDVEARVSLFADGAIRVLDARAPRIYVRDAEEEKNAQAFDFTFFSAESALLAVGGESDLTEPPYQRMPHATSASPLSAEWDFKRLDPNLLPLKFCRWKVGDENWSRQMALDMVRAEIGKMVSDGETVMLKFAFDSDLDASDMGGDAMRLALLLEENPELKARLNGTDISANRLDDFAEYFASGEGDDWQYAGILSKHFCGLDAAESLKAGENELELEFQWGLDSVVEYPILAGDFAVTLADSGAGSLGHEPRRLKAGSWTMQGYPYYAGRMVYLQEIMMEPEERHRYFIRLDKPHAASVKLRVGEHEAAHLDSHPHRFEITRLAPEGRHVLRVEVVSSLYNIYGPVHLAPKSVSPFMPPAAWDELPNTDRRLWNNKPTLADFGLMGGIMLESYDPSAPPPARKEAKKEDSNEEAPEDALDDEESADQEPEEDEAESDEGGNEEEY